MAYELSANLEWIFGEAGDGVAERVRAAGAAGVPAVEIWGWRSKDIDALAEALTQTGVVLQTMCVDPMGAIVNPSAHQAFLGAVADAATVAERLGCPYLVVTAGDARPGVTASEQRAAIVTALTAAAGVLADRDVTLLLENLNSRVDHVGTFLDSTVEALDIVAEVASPRVRMLYDHYHSVVMEEDVAGVLAGRMELVGHVQIADTPGRNEPGTGRIDWPVELSTLRRAGYGGRLGLEYRPTGGSVESMRLIAEVAAGA